MGTSKARAKNGGSIMAGKFAAALKAALMGLYGMKVPRICLICDALDALDEKVRE
jgi:hypothetical protein